MSDGSCDVWTCDQLAVLGDERLSGDERALGMLLSHAGPEGLAYEALEGLMPDLSRDRLRRHIQKLERTRWVERRVGGRGHPDVFVFLGSAESASYPDYRLAALHTLSDRVPNTRHLNALRVGVGSNLRAPTTTTSNNTTTSTTARARGSGEITVEAERAIEGAAEVLAGCRGSLRDYLKAKVEASNQHGYVQRVVMLVSGGVDEYVWRGIVEGRPSWIAAAFNELLADAEVGQHFRSPPGHFNNLRSTLRYLVNSKEGAAQDLTRSAERSAARKEAADLERKRDDASARQVSARADAEKARLEEEARRHADELAAARSWLEDQPVSVQQRATRMLEASLTRLGYRGRPDRAPTALTGPALVQTVAKLQEEAVA